MEVKKDYLIEYYFNDFNIYNPKIQIINIPKKRFNEQTKKVELVEGETRELKKLSFSISCGKKHGKKLGYVNCCCWLNPDSNINIDPNKTYKASFWAYFSNNKDCKNGVWKNYTCWNIFAKFDDKSDLIRLKEIKQVDQVDNDVIIKDNSDPIIAEEKELEIIEDNGPTLTEID